MRLKQVEAEWQTLDVSEEIVRWMSEMQETAKRRDDENAGQENKTVPGYGPYFPAGLRSKTR